MIIEVDTSYNPQLPYYSRYHARPPTHFYYDFPVSNETSLYLRSAVVAAAGPTIMQGGSNLAAVASLMLLFGVSTPGPTYAMSFL